MKMYKAGIVGATGYTGSELARLLINHPDVHLEAISSESNSGTPFSDIHSQFYDIIDDQLITLNELSNKDLDVVFLALPHGVSMDFVKDFHNKPYKIIDLSGDFRFKNRETYEKWYKQKHNCPEYLSSAVYGLPELNADLIKKSKLIGVPGCYPTSSILPLAPLVKEGLLEISSIIIDSKSGVTGAGVKPKKGTHFPSVNDNFNAYSLKDHRHTPEISEVISNWTGQNVSVQFTPHLLPVNRGILTTTYSTAKENVNDKTLKDVYEKYYKNMPFIRIRNSPPSISDVRGSNYCDIYATFDERTNRVITVSCIDNLIKGAAGQAIQCMNIILGLDERSGLKSLPLSP